jgi:lariat debranching enzyme
MERMEEFVIDVRGRGDGAWKPPAAIALDDEAASRPLVAAVVGCVHGQIDDLYEAVLREEARAGRRADVVLCCGDFQALRDRGDLRTLACPDKYRSMGQFGPYFRGEKRAPRLTLFVGGNHEASAYLQELYHGGWVAPDMYYLGAAGVVRVAGVRIAGLSGIYKAHDFPRGHFERPPYALSDLHSVYHVRSFDVFRLLCLAPVAADARASDGDPALPVVLSHDWPQHVARCGDLPALLRAKPFFRADIESGDLGSPPSRLLLDHHRPRHWFAAHMHVRYEAAVRHAGREGETRFLALDKVLPRRSCVELVELAAVADRRRGVAVELDPEWLSVVRATMPLLPKTRQHFDIPSPSGGRYDYAPTAAERAWVDRRAEELSLYVPPYEALVAGSVLIDGRTPTPASHVLDWLQMRSVL